MAEFCTSLTFGPAKHSVKHIHDVMLRSLVYQGWNEPKILKDLGAASMRPSTVEETLRYADACL